jgi:hypothetical protein
MSLHLHPSPSPPPSSNRELRTALDAHSMKRPDVLSQNESHELPHTSCTIGFLQMPVTRGNVELVQYIAEVTFELGQEAWVWMSASGMGWI